MSKLFLLAALVAVAASSAVVSLNPTNFDQSIGGSKATLVKFFAPWCGHCKALAPEYEKAAESFATSTSVQIAEVDCDAHSDLCQRFGVQGYPTIKFFPKNEKTPSDYEGGRTAEDIVSFLKEKGAAVKSNVVSLTPATFDSIALNADKDVLIKFFAPWCGHCKALAPAYNKLADAYAAEDSVVIAEVNCDNHHDLCSKYEVTGFPTLKFFPKGNKAGTAYTGGRDLDAFVTFLNENLNLHRKSDGRLDASAGRVAALDAIATQFQSGDKAALLAEAKKAAEGLVGTDAKQAKIYIKTMESVVAKGADFIATEKARVQRYVDGGQVSAKKVDDFTMRLNILAQF